MGSRYGALKQMDGVGPNNEAILDYSIYDAKRQWNMSTNPLTSCRKASASLKVA